MINIGKSSNPPKIKQIQSKKKIPSNCPGITLVKNIVLNIHKDRVKWILSCTTDGNVN